jgi:hypothetical protein
MVKRASEVLGQGFVWPEQGDEAWNRVGQKDNRWESADDQLLDN